MTELIFRKSDSLYVGAAHPPHSVEVEIVNITTSALGGQIEDYLSINVTDWLSGQLPVLSGDQLSVSYIEHPRTTQRTVTRNTLTTKLSGLGLTPDEISILVRR